MKAEELMIGDWVELYNGNGEHICDSKVDINILYTLSDNNQNTVVAKPIPLTPEILEKNGFKKELAKDGIHYCFTLINDNTKFSLLYARSVFQWLGPLDFKYVHELQHALRLCNIDKEIVL